MTTWRDIVHAEARTVGRSVTDDNADAILWEHTGFPSFYLGDDPVAYFTGQIRDFFAGKLHCMRCGAALVGDGVAVGAELCVTCVSDLAKEL